MASGRGAGLACKGLLTMGWCHRGASPTFRMGRLTGTSRRGWRGRDGSSEAACTPCGELWTWVERRERGRQGSGPWGAGPFCSLGVRRVKRGVHAAVDRCRAKVAPQPPAGLLPGVFRVGGDSPERGLAGGRWAWEKRVPGSRTPTAGILLIFSLLASPLGASLPWTLPPCPPSAVYHFCCLQTP